jgi:hypothetical protein
MTWSTPHDDCLRTLWGQGYSAQQIADRIATDFNTRYSRNAVLGRCFRLKLERRKPRQQPASPARQQRLRSEHAARFGYKLMERKVMLDRRRFSPCEDPPVASVKAQALAAESVEQESRVTLQAQRPRARLMDLTLRSCRWPLWSDSAHAYEPYCGEVTACSGCMYCAYHRAKAWRSGSSGRERETGGHHGYA